jgi:hypothetical protein
MAPERLGQPAVGREPVPPLAIVMAATPRS